MSKLISLACASALALPAMAQVRPVQTDAGAPPVSSASTPAAPAAPRAPAATPAATLIAPGAPAAVVPSVTVSGSRANDTDTRRLSTAAKMVFGREELDRNGDSSVGEILKRLPGVTMGGPPGRGGGGGVRMRGLGNGYTQMLVNGERPPAGVSLESLAPEQVERIEVMRGPVAEHSTQAIAGTINIVLREGYQQKDMQLKLNDSIEQGRHTPNVSLTAPFKAGALSVLLNGSVSSGAQADTSVTFNEDVRLADASTVLRQRIDAASERDTRSLHVAPRLSYRFDNGDTLNFQPFMAVNRSDGASTSTLAQSIGARAPEYALALGHSENESTFFRGFGNWLKKLDDGAKLDVKFGFGGGKSDNQSRRLQYDAAGKLIERFDDTDKSKQYGASTGGKYTRSLGQGHLLAAGWDIEGQHREQTSIALVDGQPRFPLGDGSPAGAAQGENLTADTRRLAAFVQDEWDINPQWSVYLGLRWEGIRTTSDDAERLGGRIKNTTSVWSPVLHGVWRIPGRDKDQIRASLTQSYKAPQLNDLIATPSYSQLNSATRPDRTGNPDLKPELARGIDLAYEHYVGKSGIVSASGFVRDIDNLMRRELSLRDTPSGPRWLSTPSNVGRARTSGIELEAKFQLAELVPDAPNMDLRANYSRFWSSVDGIPGPDNRLDQQAKQTANLGIDYRLKGLPLTLGGSYNWTPETPVQTSLTERAIAGVKRQADVYALWKFSAATQLRVAANNLAADDYYTGRMVTTNGLAQNADAYARTFTTWSVRLEMKL